MDPDVVIVLIGDEILTGRTRDANGHWLARRLDDLGYRARRIVVVPDEDATIRAEVRDALRRAPTVLVSGGLGPTHDDRTTAALAAEFGRRLVVDEEGWERLARRYEKRFGSLDSVAPETMEAAKRMVTVPEGARTLPNPVGAAVGYVLEEDGRRVMVMPGVPAEVQAIFDGHVARTLLPQLRADAVLELDVNLQEAAFAHGLRETQEAFPDVSIGSYPHFGEMRVTLRFRGTPERARAARDAVAARYAEHVLRGRSEGGG